MVAMHVSCVYMLILMVSLVPALCCCNLTKSRRRVRINKFQNVQIDWIEVNTVGQSQFLLFEQMSHGGLNSLLCVMRAYNVKCD